MTEIRSVKESELNELLGLLQAKAEFDGCPDTLLATVDNLREALFSEKPAAHALVAIDNGVIVGMATYFPIFSTFMVKRGIWLDDLFVFDSHRSRGIGKALMEHLCQIADSMGCGRVDWLVSRFNDRGQQFYKNIGAVMSDKARLVRLDETAIKALAADNTQPIA